MGDAHEVGDGPGKTCSFPNKCQLKKGKGKGRGRSDPGEELAHAGHDLWEAAATVGFAAVCSIILCP